MAERARFPPTQPPHPYKMPQFPMIGVYLIVIIVPFLAGASRTPQLAIAHEIPRITVGQALDSLLAPVISLGFAIHLIFGPKRVVEFQSRLRTVGVDK